MGEGEAEVEANCDKATYGNAVCQEQQGREGPARQGGQVWATRRFFREGSSELDFLGEKRMATIPTMIIANDTH